MTVTLSRIGAERQRRRLRRGRKQMNGRFQKGKSGNPGGRPKAAHSIQELARKHAPEAIKTLADIAKKGTPGARVSAAIALLDRAYGKPPQFNTSDAGSFRKAVDMNDDELAAIAARAKLTVV
jgi:Family of unknown function (DUF5681)